MNIQYDNECDEECNRCGEKREAPHRWEEASCEEAKRCRRCGKTEGEALGHRPGKKQRMKSQK